MKKFDPKKSELFLIYCFFFVLKKRENIFDRLEKKIFVSSEKKLVFNEFQMSIEKAKFVSVQQCNKQINSLVPPLYYCDHLIASSVAAAY